MPIYQYKVINEDGSDGITFEIEQRMSEPALTEHPITGKPVKRIYFAPNLTTRYTQGGLEKKLDAKNLDRHGFTRYERDKLTGKYHKTAGTNKQAPDVLNRPSA